MNKNKQTNKERIVSKQTKRPSFVYNILGFVLKPIMKHKYGVTLTFKCDKKELTKCQHIFVSNHTSRIDYFFNAFDLLPAKYNFVVGHNEFYRSQFLTIFNLLQTIPKMNFVPDIYAMKEIVRIISKKGNIFIFPEGMNSISGYNQPVAIGTGKMIKHFKLPVFYSVISGGYLTCPKYTLEERPGKIEVVVDKMFSEEDIEKLSPEEIEDIMNEKLFHDDYKWNKIKGYSYKVGENVASNLESLLFICPKCHKKFTMEGTKNIIRCTSCGNGATIDDKYNLIPLDEDCVIPETQTDWFKWEREIIREEVKADDYKFETKVKLGTLPEDHLINGPSTSEITGEGILTIDHTGLTYNGTRDGQEFNVHINSLSLPSYGMCTDTTRFYTFATGEFLEFYPETKSVEQIVIATEEIHRLSGGKWQDFKFEY